MNVDKNNANKNSNSELVNIFEYIYAMNMADEIITPIEKKKVVKKIKSKDSKIISKATNKANITIKKDASKPQNKSKIEKPQKNYPSVTLEKCLNIALKIKELNGGNPWTPKEVSQAINVKGTMDFFYTTSSSRDFGLTVGTSSAKQIELTEFGRAIVYAPNPDVERNNKIQAFLNIPIFKNVLEYYKGSMLPEMKYLSNTLEHQFKLSPDFHEEFSRVFNENCRYLGITTGENLTGKLSNTSNGVSRFTPTTIVVGETKKGKLKAFVIMPFVERDNKRPLGFFKEVLDSLLIPAGIDADFTIETANKQGSDVIQSTIINDLLEADLVIADLTDHNPNVLFELGVRMAADKPVALIKSKDTGRIFDVDNMLRVYEYNPNLWKSTIEKDVPELKEHFRAAWDNRDSEMSYMKILRREAQK
ncbi:hypothetical protein [Mucilaginibacter sp. L196]|uniref:hypothetical protein n=1 Tax=Mucilaginibacter sp. L196 TaxID=1641870 RepID=UPI001C20C203|nr:hypothetical protein [Mucilaginibacter sp. L196]